ncbi:MAG: ABC transporter substrate-binding protein [Hyphomicrobium aestuarii]|nr:ABC transporter substrate-binding protein [Hyphomicrobium aestuarii]
MIDKTLSMPAALRLLAFFVAAIAADVGCGGSFAVADPKADQVSEFSIGLAIATDGPKAALSTALQSAIDAEAKALSPRPDLHVEADGCTANGGADAARRLVEKGVKLVFGHPCASAAIAAAKVYAAAGVAFIAVGARHPDLTDKRAGPLVFRLGGRDDRQAADTALALQDSVRGRKLAIVHDRTRYQRRLADGISAAFKGIVADTQVYPIIAAEKGYEALITALRVRAPDMVYLALFPTEARVIASALLRAGLKPSIIFAEATTQSDDDWRQFPSPNDMTWIRSTASEHAELATAAARALVSIFPYHQDLTAERLMEALNALPNGDAPSRSYRALRR